MTETKIWHITPLDPLVFGALGSLQPSTVAGMVRARFVEQGRPEEARTIALRALERVWIRGPWVVGTDSAGEEAPWFPPPADGAVEDHADDPGRETRLFPARLLECGADEGVSPFEDFAGLRLLSIPERQGAVKTSPLARWRDGAWWPMGALVPWSTGQVGEAKLALTGKNPLTREVRVHVSVDPKSQTAAPGLLFSSRGLRWAEEFGLGVEVHREPGTEPLPWPPDNEVIILGGESRLSVKHTAAPGTGSTAEFPPFARYEAKYALAAERFAARALLRLQLLTPAYLGNFGWRPSWIDSENFPGLPDSVRLQLDAVCIPGFSAISGWNLQAASRTRQGAPRAVRRLVPAGSVYYFRVLVDGAPPTGARWVELCRSLWGAVLEPAGAVNEFLAPPGRDGYGLLLPGIWPAEGPGKDK